MRSPLPLVALLYAGGLVLAQYIPARLTWLFPLALGLGGLAIALKSSRPLILLLLLPMAGWTNLLSRTAVLSSHDLRLLLSDRSEYVTLRGTLLESPVLRVSERRNRVLQRSMVEIEVEGLLRNGWEPAVGRVIASTPGVLDPGFHSGRSVEVTGVLQPSKGPVAPGQFDYRTYLCSRGIYYQLRCENTNAWRTFVEEATSNVPPWSDRFCRWAQAVLGKGLGGEDEALRLLWAMVLGWKTALTQEVAEPFMQSGTLHIFAISGLHIALIAGILISLLLVLRVPRGASGWVVLPLIWFYTAATGWQASAVRSTIMMSIVIGGWALRRPSHLINSLAASGLIILMWDPPQLFQAGFQLSFFVVLGIALLVPSLTKVRDQLLRPDPLLPPELRPKWKRWLDWPVRAVTTSLATSLAAWLGSMPLIASYFNMVTPGSLLANLLIVPISGLALMSSLGSLICGNWLPSLTELFNHSSWLWMLLMIRLSEWFAELPGAYFYIRPPSLWTSAAYYLLLGGVFSGVAFSPRWRLGSALLFGAALVGLLVPWLRAQQQVQLTVLPIRAGATFFDAPGLKHDLLVDCGDPSVATSILKPFLRSQGVNRLSAILLTQGDLAHMGGTELLSNHFRARRILTSPAPSRSRVYRELLPKLQQTPQRWNPIRSGDKVAQWKVLHPGDKDRFPRASDNAVVLHGEVFGTRVLLLSDLGRLGQRALLERESDLTADILITAASNQADSLGQQVIDAVKPRLMIVAGADFPPAARANRQLRDKLAQLEVPVIYTCDSGAAVLTFHRDGWSVDTMDGTVVKSRDPVSARRN